jgi:hypothetical protein
MPRILHCLCLLILCLAAPSSQAGESAPVHLTFFTANGEKIGVGEFIFSAFSHGQPTLGKWRFKLDPGYKSPRPGIVSSGDMLNQSDWQPLQATQSEKGPFTLNLHPRNDSDWVYLQPAGDGSISRGGWMYCTDGGLVEKGYFLPAAKQRE